VQVSDVGFFLTATHLRETRHHPGSALTRASLAAAHPLPSFPQARVKNVFPKKNLTKSLYFLYKIAAN
jgi:hypothetical protein